MSEIVVGDTHRRIDELLVERDEARSVAKTLAEALALKLGALSGELVERALAYPVASLTVRGAKRFG